METLRSEKLIDTRLEWLIGYMLGEGSSLNDLAGIELFPGEEPNIDNFARVSAEHFLKQYGAGARLLDYTRAQLAARGLSLKGEPVQKMPETASAHPAKALTANPTEAPAETPAKRSRKPAAATVHAPSADLWETRRWEASVALFGDLVSRIDYQKKAKAARLAVQLADALMEEYKNNQ